MKQIVILSLSLLAFSFFIGCEKSNRPSLDEVLTQDFFSAISDNNLSEIKTLLKKEPNLVFARDNLGFTPLIVASRYGETKIVEYLLRNKSEVNAKGNMGETALFRTIDVNNFENAKILIKFGADPNIKESSQDWAPLPCASYYGNLEIVKLLIKNGADVNVTGKYDQTPLHWSMRAITWNNQKEIVKYLIQKGVDLNHEDSNGETALQMAEKRSSDGVVEILRKNTR